MTPYSNSSYSASADDTRELLGRLLDDTRAQLRRWVAISIWLRCPLTLTPRSRRDAAACSKSAVAVLRCMLACAGDAIRHFRKGRYGRCMRALKRFEHLDRVLSILKHRTARAVADALIEGGGK